jgi:hypothetical protein
VADLLGVIAGLFLGWFAASLRGVIWRAEGGEGRLATLTFAGGVLAAVGAWTVFGIDFAVADASDSVSPVVLKPLVALNNSFFLPLAGGLGLMMVASAFAILHTRALPVVAGWLALVIGIVTFTPVGFFGVLASLIWVPVVGVMIYRKGDVGQEGPRAPATAPAA